MLKKVYSRDQRILILRDVDTKVFPDCLRSTLNTVKE